MGKKGSFEIERRPETSIFTDQRGSAMLLPCYFVRTAAIGFPNFAKFICAGAHPAVSFRCSADLDMVSLNQYLKLFCAENFTQP